MSFRITDDIKFQWSDVSKLSDKELQTIINDKTNAVIRQLTNELLNKKPAVSREIACRVIHCMTGAFFATETDLASFFSALESAHVLEDPKSQFSEESYTSAFFGTIKSALSWLKVLPESYEGLTKDEALGKLYLEAIQNNNKVLAIKLLEQISDLKNTSINPRTCLFEASNQDILVLLIKKGADVNARDSKGMTLLHHAADQDNGKVATLLIEKGAAVNTKDADGWTPLHYAANQDHDQMVKTLADRGGNANARDKGQLTPLHYAVYNDNDKAIEALIDKGADVNTKEEYNITVLHSAVLGKRDKAVKALIDKGADLNIRNNYDETALYCAITSGTDYAALTLVENGADLQVEKKSFVNVPLLVQVAMNNREQIALALIEKGVDLNKEFIGKTALNYFIEVGNERVIKALIAKGADINFSAVAYAIKADKEELALALIDKLTNVNLRDRKWTTPLHLAVAKGNEKIIRALIDKGADINAVDLQGKPALIDAAINRQNKAGLILIKEGAKFNFKEKAQSHYDFLLPLLLSVFKEYGYTDEQLGFLEGCSNPEVMEVFISSNMHTLVVNKNANPLIFALLFNSPSICRQIIDQTSKSQFNTWQKEISKDLSLSKTRMENLIFEIDSTHFTSKSSALEIPDPPADVNLRELETLFDEINFTKPNEKWYRDPHKLKDEGISTTPEELKKGMRNLIGRIQNRTPFLGTPPKGTPELEEYYIDFEKLLKHVAVFIKKMDPDEKASALIDIAIMGKHCGGKIGEAKSMYRLLSKIPPEGLEDLIYAGLQDMRLGIIMDFSSRSPESYQVHVYNQLMHLLAEKLGLADAKMFKQPDHFGNELTSKKALDAFFEEYTVQKIVGFIQQRLQESYKNPELQPLVTGWLKDHTPDEFERENYDTILSKVAEMQKQNLSRREIRNTLLNDFDMYLRPDQSPEDAVATHRSDAFYKAKNIGETESAEDWNPEFYELILNELKESKYSRKEIEDFLLSKGINIERARDFKNLVEANREMKYLDFALGVNEEGEIQGITREAAQNAAVALKLIKVPSREIS